MQNISDNHRKMTSIINNIAEGIEEYPLKSKKLWIPKLENIIPYLESALRENYQKVSVRFRTVHL